ncbi:MAG: hypothetical protein CMO01_03270 [Thalassobius sp.]|nr:hypothetical protein [Thalassovita sp.]|tara:strand:+ start:302 stop:808 length:507 start_codon:yes stop_codon:yes gene_type:complete
MRALLILHFLFAISVTLAAQSSGYVLKPNQGEALGDSRTIKASPKSGTNNAVMVLDSLAPGFETTFHAHKKADELFYVINGEGRFDVGAESYEVSAGYVLFVPKGEKHNLTVSNKGSMLLLFFFDKPGADDWFRESHKQFFSKSIPMSTQDCNELGKKYGYICIESNK